ncbi:host attachment protein [Rhodospirillaceae bacterium AH-315-P19]|nr:host attachment protein [Rhodospirillaceae bacterium AH-315-P19]
MPKKPEKTWVLVADGARARIFFQGDVGMDLIPVLAEKDDQSRRPTRDIGTDKPGRIQERIADGSRHAMAPRVDWHEFEKELFAKKMAEILNQAAQKETFDRLVLVAPSKTLGALRKALGKTAREKTTAEINKDLTQVPIHELPAHLETALKQHL